MFKWVYYIIMTLRDTTNGKMQFRRARNCNLGITELKLFSLKNFETILLFYSKTETISILYNPFVDFVFLLQRFTDDLLYSLKN